MSVVVQFSCVRLIFCTIKSAMPVSNKAKGLCLTTEKQGQVSCWFQPQAKSEATMQT